MAGARSKKAVSLRAIVDAVEAREARALAERLEETVRLERARGGQVDLSPGRMRITSRDGPQTMSSTCAARVSSCVSLPKFKKQ